jgi:methylated-DNA-[protein]-cysteine S-methyltransferase
VRWWRQETPFGSLIVVTGENGVRRISLPGVGGDEPPDAEDLVGTPSPPDRRVAGDLGDWFAARRTTLTFAVDLDGLSAFRRMVLETLAREVPWGETVTYGELAALVGSPGAARAVGSALRTNPVPFVVPCHRVVAATGIGGYGGRREAVALKQMLLDRERVSTPR